MRNTQSIIIKTASKYKWWLVLTAFILQGCAPRFAIEEFYPPGKDLCVSKAKQVRNACIATNRVSVDDCKLKERAQYNLAISSYNANMSVARSNYSNCIRPCASFKQETARYQSMSGCLALLNNCIPIPDKTNMDAYNEYTRSLSEWKACESQCEADLAQVADIKTQKPQSGEQECERTFYSNCNIEAEDNFKGCGRYKIQYCYRDCKNAQFLAQCVEGDCPTTHVNAIRQQFIGR